jgi:hypothetical protein
MDHNLIVQTVEATQVVFECLNCKQLVGFSKEGSGEPHVELHEGIWILPENAGVYINPCFKLCETCGQLLPEPAAETVEEDAAAAE